MSHKSLESLVQCGQVLDFQIKIEMEVDSDNELENWKLYFEDPAQCEMYTIENCYIERPIGRWRSIPFQLLKSVSQA